VALAAAAPMNAFQMGCALTLVPTILFLKLDAQIQIIPQKAATSTAIVCFVHFNNPTRYIKKQMIANDFITQRS
jgi:hypothetical protein